MTNRKPAIFLTLGLLFIAIVGLFYVGVLKDRDKNQMPPAVEITDVVQVEAVKEQYDVVVVGTDPEGVVAAVSAARNGLKTLLVDGRNREILGGLFTLGWLNSLDMNRMPDGKDYYNKGIFKEWFDQIEGDSFDITSAANAFHRLVEAEDNIDVRLGMKAMEPITETIDGVITVTGVKLTTAEDEEIEVSAAAVIDATQDGDIAEAAGAEFTFGREDIGDDQTLMAVTPVYTLTGVTEEVWNGIKATLNGDDNPGTGANNESAWGYIEMWQYPSTNPERIRSRGLNIGRQNNETMLVNAVQIFGVDTFDQASVDEAFEIARKEIPLMVEHMKSLYPELAPVELGEIAPELYVRETRHLVGEYRLTIIDLLEQRQHWDDIAFGSYPVDIQSTSPTNTGAVLMDPVIYGVPFRTLVPKSVDGLLVVGRAGSFDTLPHGSARLVPVGMATAQAAGAAVKLAMEEGVTIRTLSDSETLIAGLKQRLTEQGMVLVAPDNIEPYDFISHPAYEGLKAAVSMAITQGGYSNDFGLDLESNPERMLSNVRGAAKVYPEVFPNDAAAALDGLETPRELPLSLEQAAYTIALAVIGEVENGEALGALTNNGWISDATLGLIEDEANLTNGNVYMLLKDILELKAGIVY